MVSCGCCRLLSVGQSPLATGKQRDVVRVGSQAIGRQLEAALADAAFSFIRKPSTYRYHAGRPDGPESVSCCARLPMNVQLSPTLLASCRDDACLFFHADERPNFVHLNVADFHALNLGVQQPLAVLANQQNQVARSCGGAGQSTVGRGGCSFLPASCRALSWLFHADPHIADRLAGFLQVLPQSGTRTAGCPCGLCRAFCCVSCWQLMTIIGKPFFFSASATIELLRTD